MKTFKQFIEDHPDPSIKTIDFRDKKPSEKALETVDFRDKPVSKILSEGKTQKKGWVHPHDEDLASNYPASDNEHVKGYTKGSLSINRHLHNKQGQYPERLAPKIEAIDHHLNRHPASRDIHLHSGLYKRPTPGEHIHHGYMSTSTDEKVAHNFAHETAAHKDHKFTGKYHDVLAHKEVETTPKGEKHVLHIVAKKGSRHGAFIGHMSTHADEREFLVKRGKKIRIHPNPERHISPTGRSTIHVWKGEFVD